MTIQHELWLVAWMLKALDLIAYKGKDKSEFMQELEKYLGRVA